jgi:hypothetical protein
MATTARPSIVHVAEEKAPIPAPGASHDCAPFVERHLQGRGWRSQSASGYPWSPRSSRKS